MIQMNEVHVLAKNKLHVCHKAEFVLSSGTVLSLTKES